LFWGACIFIKHMSLSDDRSRRAGPAGLLLLAALLGWPGAAAGQLLTGPQTDRAAFNRYHEAASLRAELPSPAADYVPYRMDEDNGPVDLAAENLIHDEDAQLITASGNVELVQGQRILRAQQMTYNLATDEVTARGDVVLIEANGDVHFAEEVSLSDRMRAGFVQSLQSYLADGGRFTAREGERRDGTLLIMRHVTYTPCNCEADLKGPPTWLIRAQEVTHDDEQNRISYRHARFELMGVPVIYTPYLSHPDGTVERKSGLLTPSFGYDSALGFHMTQQYYVDIAPHKDATFGVMLTSRETPVAVGQYRHRFNRAEMQVEGSATHASRLNRVDGEMVGTDEKFRGHIFADALWDINEQWRAGLNLELASDDQYLRRYKFSNKDVLENEIYAERFSGRHYGVGRLLAFQDVRLLEEQLIRDQDQPNVLPEIIANFIGEPNALLGGRWELEGTVLGLQRDDGQDVVRLTGQGGWQRRHIADSGLVSTIDLSLRGDAYKVHDRELSAGVPRDQDGSSTETRIFPQAHLVSSYPLVRQLERADVIVAPVAAITVAPALNNRDNEIPNEDSQDAQLDASNLFAQNRFPGRDRIEDRSRVTYGLRSGLYGHRGSFGEVFAGQSYNLRDDSPFPRGSGLSRRQSDYVGQVSGAYRDIYHLNYRFQLSSHDLSSSRHELDAGASWNRLQLHTNYLYAEGLQGSRLDDSREQIFVGAGYRISDKWRVRGTALRNLGNDPALRKASLGFDYFGCCLSFSAMAHRNLTDTVSGESSTEVTFRIGLKGLGEFQASDGGRFGVRNRLD